MKEKICVLYDTTNKEWNIFTPHGSRFFAEDSDGFKSKKDIMSFVKKNADVFELVEPV
jgi:hypothetical protein